MADTKEKPLKRIPSLKNYGGVRTIQKTLARSATLENNREAVAYALLCMANTRIDEIMTWDENGNVKVKASKDIPEHALQAIKSIKSRETYDKDGGVIRTIDIELFDKVGVLRLMAKASGLLDQQQETDKPSIIGINIKAPEVIDVDE